MKKPIKIAIAVVVVLFALNIAKNGLVQFAMGSGISAATHVPVSIGGTNLSLFAGSIKVTNFKLKNPWGYKDKVMVDVPLIFIDFDMSSIGKPKLRFEDVQVHLKEVTIVKNAKGEVNVNALKPKKDDQGKPAPKKAAPKFHIDKLTLSIDKVVYKDYTGGGKPNVQTFDVNIKNRTFTHMEDPTAIVSVIMLEALTRTSIAKIADLDTSFLTDNAKGILNEGLGLVKDGAGTLETQAKNVLSIFQ